MKLSQVPCEFPVNVMVTVRYFGLGYGLQIRIAELAHWERLPRPPLRAAALIAQVLTRQSAQRVALAQRLECGDRLFKLPGPNALDRGIRSVIKPSVLLEEIF